MEIRQQLGHHHSGPIRPQTQTPRRNRHQNRNNSIRRSKAHSNMAATTTQIKNLQTARWFLTRTAGRRTPPTVKVNPFTPQEGFTPCIDTPAQVGTYPNHCITLWITCANVRYFFHSQHLYTQRLKLSTYSVNCNPLSPIYITHIYTFPHHLLLLS